MKPLYVLTPLACLFTLFALAQDPTTNATAYNSPPSINMMGAGSKHKISVKKAPLWKKGHDQVDGHIDHSLLKTMEKTTETIISLLKDSCLSVDPSIPVWHGEFVSEKHSLSSRLTFGLECDFQGSAQLRITANEFDLLFQDTLYVNGKLFLTLKGTTAVKNGFPYFEYPRGGENPAAGGAPASGSAPASAEDTANAQAMDTKLWLVVTDPEKLPYIPVTRKEYLDEAIQEVKVEKNKVIAAIKARTPLRPIEIQQAEKENEMEQVRQNYSGIEREMRLRRFLETYKTDEDYQKDGIEKGTADLEATLRLMDTLLTHLPANELKKAAIVTVPAIKFEGFEDNLPGRSMLMQVNPAYFDAALSAEKPQCFLVYWNYDPSEPAAAGIDRQLNDKFDFKKLQDLLGK